MDIAVRKQKSEKIRAMLRSAMVSADGEQKGKGAVDACTDSRRVRRQRWVSTLVRNKHL